MRRSAALTAAAVVLCLTLSACQPGDDASGTPHPAEASPSESGSPSPSVDPAEVAIAERAAEAERRYREYLQVTDRHRIEGTRAFPELFDERGLLGEPALWEGVEADDDLYENLKQVGETRIASVKVTGYDGDPLADGIGGHRVKLAVCLDNSEVDVVREDGTSAVIPDQLRRTILHVVMQGQQDGRWTVNEFTTTDEEC